MKMSELVEWIEKLETRNNSYWNFYTVVLVAVCGWVVSKHGEPVDAGAKWVLMLGLSVFYCMNLTIIHRTTARIKAVESEIERRAQVDEDMSEPLRTNLSRPFLRFRSRGTLALHLAMDMLVLAFVLLWL